MLSISDFVMSGQVSINTSRGGLVVSTQEKMHVLRGYPSGRPQRPGVHDQTGTLELLLLGDLGKPLQEFSDVLLVEINIGFFELMDCLIPLDEKYLVVFVDIREVAYAHSLELLLDLADIAVAVLV